MVLERWMFGALAACSIACATTSAPQKLAKPIVTFPSSGELDRVAAQPAQPKYPLQTAEVDTWVLEGPIPAPASEYVVSTPWDELLKKMVAEQAGQLALSAELACAARETARFYLQHGALPSEALQRYLVARCGSTLAAPRVAVFGGPTPDDVSDEQVQSKLHQKFPEFLKEQLPRGRGAVGLSYARGNGRAAIVFYSGEERARLDRFSPLVNGDQAVLEGEVATEAAFSLALINQGKDRVAACQADPRVQMPRFRFTCPMPASDSHARIDVAVRRTGQVLPDPVAAVLVRRNEEAGLRYEPAIPGDVQANVDATTFQTTVYSKLNALRQSTGLGALTLEPEQSQATARVAPHWFDATFKGDDRTVELLAMGLVAGWQVQGTIREGGVYAGYLTSSRSPERWLSDALGSPLARGVLLDPRATRVAIGSATLGDTGILSVVTTYSLFDEGTRAADEATVLAQLSGVREARGLTAPRHMPAPRALSEALERIRERQEEPNSAVKAALKDIRKVEQQSVSGWALETNDLNRLLWPKELLEPATPNVSIAVTHLKAPSGAWGQYAVLVVLRHTAEAGQKPSIERMPPPSGQMQ